MTITRGACAICRRQSRGYMYAPHNKTPQAACSMVCLDHIAGGINMKTFTADEDTALEHGGRAGGAYLDNLGKFDLRELSGREWAEFLRCILDGYSKKMKEFADEIPF